MDMPPQRNAAITLALSLAWFALSRLTGCVVLSDALERRIEHRADRSAAQAELRASQARSDASALLGGLLEAHRLASREAAAAPGTDAARSFEDALKRLRAAMARLVEDEPPDITRARRLAREALELLRAAPERDGAARRALATALGTL